LGNPRSGTRHTLRLALFADIPAIDVYGSDPNLLVDGEDIVSFRDQLRRERAAEAQS
jgi:hypothetical protein